MNKISEKLDLHKHIKSLLNYLEDTEERLKPLWKKKYLRSYIVFKNKSNRLKSALKKIDKAKSFDDEVKDNILKKIKVLSSYLKNKCKKPQKKIYSEAISRIKTLAKILEDIIAK